MDMNIARLDLVSIRLAVLCAESGSLSAATKRAHCSIPAGSQRLRALEGALGKTLFVRDHRGLQPTKAGELFVRHAKVILGHLEILGQLIAATDNTGEPPSVSRIELDGASFDRTLSATWAPFDTGTDRPLGATMRLECVPPVPRVNDGRRTNRRTSLTAEDQALVNELMSAARPPTPDHTVVSTKLASKRHFHIPPNNLR